MSEPIAYLNGTFAPLSETRLPVTDLAICLGASVTEMIRTFRHQPFRLEAHWERLERSLRTVGFPFEPSFEQMTKIAHTLLDHNRQFVDGADDFGIVLFISAGHNLTYLGASGRELARTPTFCAHTFRLPFELWADKFESGQHLITPAIRHLPADTVDPKIKSRSRMHWYLADQQARVADPHASALLLDHSGAITETSTANFFIVRDGAIMTPGEGHALGGVSQQVVVELAEKLGLDVTATMLSPYDVYNADEAFTSSTPYCMLPVTQFNGRPIGTGKRGPVFESLVSAWSELAGVDIAEQLRSGAQRATAAQG